ERTVVLRRIENVPDQIAELGVRPLLQSFRHNGEFTNSGRRDVRLGHDILFRASGEKFNSRVRVLNQTPTQGAPILRFNLDVLVALADDLIGIDDIGEQRIECGAPNASQVRPNIGAFAMQLVTRQTGTLGYFMTSIQIRKAVKNDSAC